MIHHPAFQSLVLPALLTLLGIAALAAGPGARLAAWGGLLGLLGALAWLPGFDWPAGSRNQKLPWVVLAGLGLAVLDVARGGSHGWARSAVAWLGGLGAWTAGAAWLSGGTAGTPALVAAIALGGVVLCLLAWSRNDTPAAQGALAAAAMTLAALGLAGLAGTGGSLLLAQLALMLASSVAVTGGWAWLRRSSGAIVTPVLWLAFGLAWLAIAWSWVLATPAAAAGGAGAVRVACLASVFLVPAFLTGWRASPRAAPRWRWAGMLLAVGLVVLAVAWPGGTDTAPLPDTSADPDDPYLTPTSR